jgi:lipopolysaccharide/colanic/teichoic acid biosynthesis glycosyltransferase
MVNNEIDEVSGFSPGDSSRVTKMGKILRYTKIDELPELFNIIRGEMSFVGPRPEVAKYVNAYLKDYEYILKVRPGLSDYASIKYLDEEQVLADQADPEKYYWNVILPDKIRLAKNYVEKLSFRIDMSIVTHTLKSVLNLTNKRK